MIAQEKLEAIKAWFDSGDAYKLIVAYRDHWENGTLGTGWSQDRPAVINEHGVLRPERFEEYMLKLQTRVTDALRAGADMRSQPMERTLLFLQLTLEQMIGSVTLPDEETRRLFTLGKDMGRTLHSYRDAIGESRVPVDIRVVL